MLRSDVLVCRFTIFISIELVVFKKDIPELLKERHIYSGDLRCCFGFHTSNPKVMWFAGRTAFSLFALPGKNYAGSIKNGKCGVLTS